MIGPWLRFWGSLAQASQEQVPLPLSLPKNRGLGETPHTPPSLRRLKLAWGPGKEKELCIKRATGASVARVSGSV